MVLFDGEFTRSLQGLKPLRIAPKLLQHSVPEPGTRMTLQKEGIHRICLHNEPVEQAICGLSQSMQHATPRNSEAEHLQMKPLTLRPRQCSLQRAAIRNQVPTLRQLAIPGNASREGLKDVRSPADELAQELAGPQEPHMPRGSNVYLVVPFRENGSFSGQCGRD